MYKRQIDQCAAIESKPYPWSAPIKSGAKYKFQGHVDIMERIFGAGLESVGVIIIPLGIQMCIRDSPKSG